MYTSHSTIVKATHGKAAKNYNQRRFYKSFYNCKSYNL